MTSTSVRDGNAVINSPIMNFVRQRNTAVSGSDVGGFGQAMSKAAEGMSENHAEAADKSPNITRQSRPAREIKPQEAAAAEEKLQEKPPGEAVDSQDGQIDGTAEENILNEAEAAGKEAITAIAEELNISEEEVIAAMEALGLMPADLLNPQNLTALLLGISGEDASALVTDEQLYGTVSKLIDQIDAIAGQLQEETGLPPEALQAALKQAADQAAAAAAEVPEEGTLTAGEEMDAAAAPAQDNMIPEQGGESDQEITIVIEKNGEITEITAKADEKGNLQATKEVTAIPTESAAAQSTGEQSTGNQQKGSENSTEQEMAGRNSLLETLLQNRSQTTEVFTEAIPVAEVPDTEQIMRQIMDVMRIQLKPEMTQLEMQLHPASLGTINVQIASKEGVITAQFTAQNDVVKAALESQLVELKENMRNQGIKVEAVEVNVQSQSFESNLWQGREGNDGGYQPDRKRARRINLNGLDLEELPDDMTEAEQLATEIMMENGGTVDFTA